MLEIRHELNIQNYMKMVSQYEKFIELSLKIKDDK